MIAMLETAFWQMKRYQQPMIALLFPLAGWALLSDQMIGTGLKPAPAESVQRNKRFYAGILLVVSMAVVSELTLPGVVRMYADNVREVAISQTQMAQYVAENIPATAIIGVHDIGVMRYLSGHPTYDVVGLTTPGAAR